MTLLKQIRKLFRRDTENSFIKVKDNQEKFKGPIDNNASNTDNHAVTFGRFDVIVVGVSFSQAVL
jgi:hypothetical protein